MRICLASLHPRRLSGQIESLAALARELVRLGHDVRLVTAFDEDLLDREIDRPVEREIGASAGGKLRQMVKSSARLARAGESADLIHVNLPTPAFSLLADLLHARIRGRCPIVVGYESQLVDVRAMLRGGYLRRAWRFYAPLMLANNGLWGRLALYRCERYVVASRVQRTELQALGVAPARIVTLPNLIDAEKLGREGPRGARQDLLGNLESGSLIGWCGHYHDVKGVETLLQAFKSLSDERPDLRLALAWSGIGDPAPVQAGIRSLRIESRVVQVGRVNVGRFLAALDALAAPYRLTVGQGAFPNLVLEAMAVGVPLVTSDLPLLRELVMRDNLALLAPPDNPAALSFQLARLLDEPSLAASMVSRQRRLMSGELSAGCLASRYASLYSDILAGL